MSASETFLSRWSRRKRANTSEESALRPASPTSPLHPNADPQAQKATHARASTSSSEDNAALHDAQGRSNEAQSPAASMREPADAAPTVDTDERAQEVERPLPPIASLRPDSDFTAFMQAGVDPSTRASALRRLFADPHFNKMDGLDIYIDDYGKPDPIPLAMLKVMNQAHSLGLFSSTSGQDEHTTAGPDETPRDPDAAAAHQAGGQTHEEPVRDPGLQDAGQPSDEAADRAVDGGADQAAGQPADEAADQAADHARGSSTAS